MAIADQGIVLDSHENKDNNPAEKVLAPGRRPAVSRQRTTNVRAFCFLARQAELLRVALSTDSIATHNAEVFATHFVMAEIIIFPYEELEAAARWVIGQTKNDVI